MAKKFGKFLLITAAVGSAAAAAYYFIHKKDVADIVDEDDDYDDFSEDLDDDAESSRNYVPLTPDAAPADAGKDEKKDPFVPLDKVAQSAETAAPESKGEKAQSKADVEEFFDEEDAAGEEPPIIDN